LVRDPWPFAYRVVDGGDCCPVLVNYLHDTRVAKGVPRDDVYDLIFYVLATLLVAGFICNALIRPVHAKWHMKEEGEKIPSARGLAIGSKDAYGIGRGGSRCQGVPRLGIRRNSARLGRVEDSRKRRENLSISGTSGPAKGRGYS
jgi:hypothetical protein